MTSLRKALCWIGVIAIAVIILSASRYDVPVTGGHYELFEGSRGDSGQRGGWAWVEEKDYSNVPLFVKIGMEYGLITAIGGALLLWGALKK